MIPFFSIVLIIYLLKIEYFNVKNILSNFEIDKENLSNYFNLLFFEC